ncbi:MAG: winged helix-turn-helix domain-containing protein [Bacteroidia bacterium]|nr:winged helix-turn-helix domain-containing protein [Bacteroidia bacterium]
MIGHQVLLSSKDSTSRVLPIVKEDDRYKIQFETEFEFIPEALVATIDRVVKDTGLASSYIVEVQECGSGEVVYSFKMEEVAQSDIVPCQSRIQESACYNLLFTLLDRESENAIITIESKPANDSKATIKKYLSIGALVLMFSMVSFFLWNRMRNLPKDPNLIPLGEYQFDKRNTELLIEEQRIELTSKEADLLLLLYDSANTTVERDVILNLVWGDEGDYVGRTLDVFISKLRKKLEFDSKVKIVNIRGVGYKLVMDD